MVKLIAIILLVVSAPTWAALVDPTKPPNYQAEVGEDGKPAEPMYSLKMVLIGTERKLALINGRMYSEGDEVNGAKILAIHEDSVEVLKDSGELLLLLVEPEDKAPWRFKKVYVNDEK